MQTKTDQTIETDGLSKYAMSGNGGQGAGGNLLYKHNLLLETYDELLKYMTQNVSFEDTLMRFRDLGFLVGGKTKRELRVLYDLRFSNSKTQLS